MDEEKEQKEENKEQFDYRDSVVGSIHILNNMKEQNITSWEMSSINLCLNLLERELKWAEEEVTPPFDVAEEDSIPIGTKIPESEKTEVEAKIEGMMYE